MLPNVLETANGVGEGVRLGVKSPSSPPCTLSTMTQTAAGIRRRASRLRNLQLAMGGHRWFVASPKDPRQAPTSRPSDTSVWAPACMEGPTLPVSHRGIKSIAGAKMRTAAWPGRPGAIGCGPCNERRNVMRPVGTHARTIPGLRPADVSWFPFVWPLPPVTGRGPRTDGSNEPRKRRDDADALLAFRFDGNAPTDVGGYDGSGFEPSRKEVMHDDAGGHSSIDHHGLVCRLSGQARPVGPDAGPASASSANGSQTARQRLHRR